VGDIILKADGKKAESAGDLSGLLQGKKKGDKIKLDIVRDKKARSVEVPVAEDEKSNTAIIRDPEDLASLALDSWRKNFANNPGSDSSGDLFRRLSGDPSRTMPKSFFSPEMLKIMKGNRVTTFI